MIKKAIFFILIFLAIGGYIIKSNLDLALDEKDDQKTFAYEFGKWTVKLGKNLKDLTGQAIKQEWLPKNETNNTDSIE